MPPDEDEPMEMKVYRETGKTNKPDAQHRQNFTLRDERSTKAGTSSGDKPKEKPKGGK